MPNFKNMTRYSRTFSTIRTTELSVPYGPGIPLIVYNPETVTAKITGYESLWDPSLEDSVALMDSERVVMGMVLKTMGQSFNTEDLR